MNVWQFDLLTSADSLQCKKAVFEAISWAVSDLRFEHCAYGLRTAWPASRPETLMLSNYPVAWQDRYERCRYLEIDPTVRHAERSDAPVVWRHELFSTSQPLWEEAQAAGLRVGTVSENTVKFHIRNVIAKLKVTNKTAAAVCAAMSGMLD